MAQYAGRLHRNYEGKQEVRIYDYVDIHVPTLERMYHKRMKGYAELGYQVKFGAADQFVSVIYDGHSSMLPFEPVSYTHLDVYKRQCMCWRTTASWQNVW